LYELVNESSPLVVAWPQEEKLRAPA
jgi:hypothetical protein